jgi:hypothetical protein
MKREWVWWLVACVVLVAVWAPTPAAFSFFDGPAPDFSIGPAWLYLGLMMVATGVFVVVLIVRVFMLAFSRLSRFLAKNPN